MALEANDLPDGWLKTTFGDVFELKYGKGLPAKRRSNEGYPVYGSNGIVGNHSVPLTNGPTLIVGRKGSIGEVHLSDDKCWPIDTTYFIDDFFGQPPVFWLKLIATMPLSDLNRATALPGLNRNDVYRLPISLPPLNEQKRIVAKIEELQSHSRRAKEALETIPDLLDQLRQSILSAAFIGDLTRKWREKNPDVEPATELLKRIRIERRKRWEDAELEKLEAKGLVGDKLDAQFAKRRKQYKEPVPSDTTDLPKLPEGWCWTTLNELKYYSIYGPRFSNEAYSNKGVYVLRTTDIDGLGRVNTSTAPRLELSQKEYNKYKVEKGDLLITRTGSIGTLAVYNDKVDAIPGAYLLHYRLTWDHSLTWLIFHQLKSPRCQLLMTGGSAGTGRPNLNAPTLEKIPMALPSYEEQIEILRVLALHIDSLETMDGTYSYLLNKVDYLNECILNKAFSGKLVPQDPNDEPASVLLQRIHKEKEYQLSEQKAKPKPKDRRMKLQQTAQKDIISILQGAARPMTPEALFAAGNFGEDSVDTFYEQLRSVVLNKKVREIRKGKEVLLEAAT